ncbi:MAG: hypothetical protein C4525_14825 [Desulfarculus sp.]|nr:MAG: hypothetical protein C4525_14825 [Desulfarculus sp.]
MYPSATSRPHYDSPDLWRSSRLLFAVQNFSFRLAMLILGAWALGRAYEVFSSQVLFSPQLARPLTLAVWVLLGLFLLARVGVLSLEFRLMNQPLTILSWALTGILLLVLAKYFMGYRIAAVGMASALAGLSGSADQAIYALFKFSPTHPAIPAVVGAALSNEISLKARELVPFLFSAQALAAYSLFSLALGAGFFLLRTDTIFPKLLHLFWALGGVLLFTQVMGGPANLLRGVLHLVRGGGPPAAVGLGELLLLNLAAILTGVFQVLLGLSLVRRLAWQRAPYLPPRTLPPGPFKLLLVIYLVVPLLADLQNRFQQGPGIK